MKYKLEKVLGFEEATDGYSKLERKLIDVIAQNTVETLYSSLPTDRMRFIVAAHFEVGHGQETISRILGISQPTLNEEIELIKMIILGYKFKPRKKLTLNTEKVLEVIARMANV